MSCRKLKPLRWGLLGGVIAAGVLCALGFLNQPRQSRQPVALAPDIKLICVENLGKIDARLQAFDERQLTTANTPWTLFHVLLGRTRDFELSDQNDSKKLTCLTWLLQDASWKPRYEGMPFVRVTHGMPTFAVREEDKAGVFQGHLCQFLWVLTECGLSPDDVRVQVSSDQALTLRQLMQNELSLCTPYSDLSWSLPVAVRWEGRSRWADRFGNEVTLDRMFQWHISNRQNSVACFGTHYWIGLACALNSSGKQISRETRTAASTQLGSALKTARQTLTEEGQFPLEVGTFPLDQSNARQPAPKDRQTMLSHQGHMLTWICMGLTDDELAQQAWPHLATRWLLKEMEKKESFEWGGYSHAIHALRWYRKRMSALDIISP